MPSLLKESVIRLLLQRLNLDPKDLGNFRALSNIPFMCKVIEQVVAGQVQQILNEADCLRPFQSGFRPSYGTENALITLVDDLRWVLGRGNMSLLIFLNLF